MYIKQGLKQNLQSICTKPSFGHIHNIMIFFDIIEKSIYPVYLGDFVFIYLLHKNYEYFILISNK